MKLYKSQLLGATMDLTQRRIYFWGGIFSQWAKCNIHDPSFNVTFNCAEQAMMYHKADTFADEDAKAAVMAEKDPRGQKAIGRTIKNYDNDTWDQVKYDIVVRNNLLKFSQSPSFKEVLIFTDGYELVEASPFDKIWGVGLGEDDKMILDKSKWEGLNLLGRAIDEAREQIIENL